MRTLFRFFLLALLAVLTVLALAGGWLWQWAHQPIKIYSNPVDFRIVAGSGLRSACIQMRESGIEIDPNLLTLLARIQRAETGIKAGSYVISAGETPLALLDKLVRGKVTQGELTLPEGWTLRQWRARMDSNPDLRHETRGLSESEIAQRIGLDPGSRLEGRLFPDTYLFDKQSSDLELLARAQRVMKRRLEEAWAQRDQGLPYRHAQDALIMASIIEKETGKESDRKYVAAVFINRLRKGMLLQTDPTVIYGLGEAFDGNLRKRDLQSDTPYNTYTRPGLPPTPIAMPGLASIRAALTPANSDVLYFVARGDGSSEFSRTLDEHNRAVNKYQRGGK